MAKETAGLPAVLLTGGPGAGKSTVGRALAGRIGAALIDQDTVTGPMVAVVAQLVGVHDLDDVRLAGPTRQARYEAVLAIAEDNLRAGVPVVMVAPFTRERRDVDAWSTLHRRLRAAGGSPLLVWLRLKPETAARRLKARGAARDLAKARELAQASDLAKTGDLAMASDLAEAGDLANAGDLAQANEPASLAAALDVVEPVGPHLTVDGERSTEDVIRSVLAALAEHVPG
jgi:predicted kinase